MQQRMILKPTDIIEIPLQSEPEILTDFWQWAFGDLCDDDIKGVFVEWLVHKLLNIKTARRVSWANSDVITPSGIRIEVKSSAYWQSWKFINEFGDFELKEKYVVMPPNKIRFSGLVARDSTDANRSGEPSLKSDIYVFAFQKEESIKNWNALDLTQWEFYLVMAEDLLKHGAKIISLAKLRKDFKTLNAHELSIEGRETIANIEKNKRSF